MSLPKIDLNVGAPDFEDVVAQAQAANDFKPLWNRMMKTRFFVAVVRVKIDGKADFRLVLDEEEALIEISEYKDKLKAVEGAELVFLTGAQILRRTPDRRPIRLILASRNLEVAPTRVDWLKKSLEASRQALLKKQEAEKPTLAPSESKPKTGDTLPPINAITMPLPDQEIQQGKGWDFRVSTLRADTNVPGAHAPILASTPAFSYQSLELEPTKAPVKLAEIPAFDANSIRRKHVNHAGLGIEMSVPFVWQEVRNDKAIKFIDNERGIVVEVNGRRRDEMSFLSWIEMRIPLVTQELPFLRKISEPQEIQGRNWSDQISGRFLEFQGQFLGDDEESIYQFYCIQTPKNFVAIGIRAKLSQVEQLRPMLAWIVAGLEVYETKGAASAEPAANPYAAGTVVHHHRVAEDAPSPFSISMQGRIGRLRFVAYSLVSFIPLIVAGVLLALSASPFFAMAVGLVFFLLLLIRPMALRMHDLGFSAKWLILMLLLPGVLAAMSGGNAHQFGQIAGGIIYFILLLVPGHADENEYGPPCPPNSTAVTVIATIVLILNVIGNVTAYKYQDGLLGIGGRTKESKESGYGFSPPDQSYTVNFPRKPSEDASVASATMPPGIGAVHMYHSNFKKMEFMVQDIAFVQTPSDRSAALETFSTYFTSRMGDVISSDKTVIAGYQGRALQVRTKDGSLQHFRFLFAGKRIYILGVQTPRDKDNVGEVEEFFSSFQVNES